MLLNFAMSIFLREKPVTLRPKANGQKSHIHSHLPLSPTLLPTCQFVKEKNMLLPLSDLRKVAKKSYDRGTKSKVCHFFLSHFAISFRISSRIFSSFFYKRTPTQSSNPLFRSIDQLRKKGRRNIFLGVGGRIVETSMKKRKRVATLILGSLSITVCLILALLVFLNGKSQNGEELMSVNTRKLRGNKKTGLPQMNGIFFRHSF